MYIFNKSITFHPRHHTEEQDEMAHQIQHKLTFLLFRPAKVQVDTPKMAVCKLPIKTYGMVTRGDFSLKNFMLVKLPSVELPNSIQIIILNYPLFLCHGLQPLKCGEFLS